MLLLNDYTFFHNYVECISESPCSQRLDRIKKVDGERELPRPRSFFVRRDTFPLSLFFFAYLKEKRRNERRTERHQAKVSSAQSRRNCFIATTKSPLTRLPGGFLEGGQGPGKIQRVIHGSAYISSGRRRSNSRNDSPERPVTAGKEKTGINTIHGGKYRPSKYPSSLTTDGGRGTLLFKIEISYAEI